MAYPHPSGPGREENDHCGHRLLTKGNLPHCGQIAHRDVNITWKNGLLIDLRDCKVKVNGLSNSLSDECVSVCVRAGVRAIAVRRRGETRGERGDTTELN